MKGKKIPHILLVMFILLVLAMPVSATSSARTLKFGHRGEDVSKLQRALNQKGYYNYKIDGIYGKITERAVINFQIDHRIRIDGIAGPETQRTLYGSATTASRNGTSIKKFSTDDIYWLARIIQAEAGAEPYKGKVAVGNVILKRFTTLLHKKV